eukprot:scaffold348173_cov24-Prasinocladus_malaysianus.AAC.1
MIARQGRTLLPIVAGVLPVKSSCFVLQGGWREWFSVKEQRCYYVCEDSGENGWEPPLLFSFKEWQLDSQTYGISVSEARQLFESVQATIRAEPFVGGGQPVTMTAAFNVLAKVIGNVVRCGNSETKYRTVKKGNRVIAENILAVPGRYTVNRSGDE